MRTEFAIAAVALAAVSLVLFVLAIRRLLSRQAEVTVTMLRRYDDRLAEFAQTLNDALTAIQQPRREGRARHRRRPRADDAHARGRPRANGRARRHRARHRRATGRRSSPPSGCPSPRRTTSRGWASPTTAVRARSRSSFAGDLVAPDGLDPVRAGLVLPLLGEDDGPQSLLGVLTRDKGRRFSEEDVDALDELVRAARPPIPRALNLREPDVVPELDMLTNLLDRQSFPTVLEREIVRARLGSQPLCAARRRRRPAHDAQRPDRRPRRRRRAARAREAAPGGRPPPRLRVSPRRRQVRRAPPGLRGRSTRASSSSPSAPSSTGHPIGDVGVVSVSGGVAELMPRDDAGSFVARAESALAHAKRVDADRSRLPVVTRTPRAPRSCCTSSHRPETRSSRDDAARGGGEPADDSARPRLCRRRRRSSRRLRGCSAGGGSSGSDDGSPRSRSLAGQLEGRHGVARDTRATSPEPSPRAAGAARRRRAGRPRRARRRH